MSRRVRPRRLALAMAAGLGMVLALIGDLTGPMERSAYDAHLRWPADRSEHPCVVLTMDGPARQRLGRWPWTPSLQVGLLQRLQDARVVVWPAPDIVGPVPDSGSTGTQDLVPAAFARHGRVVLFAYPDQAVASKAMGARGVGHPDAVADPDLRVRSVRTLETPSAGMTVLVQRLLHPDAAAPPAQRWIRFVAPEAIRQVALSAVLAGTANVNWSDTIVLLDVEDSPWSQIATPIGAMSPIMLEAQATQSLVSHQDGHPLPLWVIVFGALGLSLAAGWIWQQMTVARGVAALSAISGTVMLSDAIAFRVGHTWLPWPTWLLALWAGYAGLAIYEQAAANRTLAVVVDQLLNSYKERKARHSFTTGPLNRHRPVMGLDLAFEERIELVGEIATTFHQERGFFQMLLESNQQPVLVVDSESLVFVCNGAGQQLLGREVIGKNLFELLAPMITASHVEELRLGFQRAWLSSKAYQRFLPIGEHTFRLNLVPTRDVEGMLCLLDDVTALHERANTDALTGLWNRRFFDEQIEVEMSRAKRYRDYSVSLVMIDVDHFKRFNDQYGHTTGDRVLRVVANVLKSVVRTSDFAVRYGGEELAVLLTHTDQEGARLFGERLRQKVADVSLSDEHGNPLLHKVTVSVGVAVFAGDETAGDLLNRADEALYRSKSGGRNQVSVA